MRAAVLDVVNEATNDLSAKMIRGRPNAVVQCPAVTHPHCQREDARVVTITIGTTTTTADTTMSAAEAGIATAAVAEGMNILLTPTIARAQGVSHRRQADTAEIDIRAGTITAEVAP